MTRNVVRHPHAPVHPTMMSFRNHRLRDFSLPTASVWPMTEIAECKGRQELYTRQSPQVLRALREQALIQSAESSNRIEGMTVAPDRLMHETIQHGARSIAW